MQDHERARLLSLQKYVDLDDLEGFVGLDGFDRMQRITRTKDQLLLLLCADAALYVRGINFSAEHVHLNLNADGTVTVIAVIDRDGDTVPGFDDGDIIEKLQVEFSQILRLNPFAADLRDNDDDPAKTGMLTFDVVSWIVGPFYAAIARDYRAGGKTLKQLATAYGVSLRTVHKAVAAARLGGPNARRRGDA
jgi:hypothetical protein